MLGIFISNCNPSKKAAATENLSFSADLSSVITTHCSPCHIPDKGGNKLALDNYANVKTHIDDIIHRIELDPGVRGFMPFKKKERLSDETINLFKKWRDGGMAE